MRRLGRVFRAIGMDDLDDGNNQDLVDPLVYAIEALGGTVAGAETVTDADLTTVTDAAALLDLAELRALENAAENYILVDVTDANGVSRKDNQLGARLDAMVAARRTRIAVTYPTIGSSSSISTGTIDLGISPHWVTCE